MADERAGEIRQVLREMVLEAEAALIPARETLIEEITAIQDDLERLGVKRERIRFDDYADAKLPELLDSILRQLETRKKFFGVNDETGKS